MNHSWNIRKLGDICTSELGKTRDEKRNKGSFRPYLCAINVQWDKFELSELKEMRFEDDEYDRYTIRKGDLVICEGGDIGRSAIWDKEEPIHYQNALHRVRFNEGIDARFILYYLLFLKQTGILDGRYGKGVTIKHLVKSSLLLIPVPVPPLDEQQHIVDELDLLSGVICKKSAQLKDLDSLSKSVFYEMFGDPTMNEQWDTRDLGDCFISIKNGANIKQTKGAKGLPITRIETLSGGVFNRDRLGYADIYDEGKYKSFFLSDGDILMSHINSKTYIGRSVVYKSFPDEKIIHGMNLLRLVSDKNFILPIYAKSFFDTDFFKRQVASIRKDAVNQSSMAVGDLKKLQILTPPIENQAAFSKKIIAIEEQKARIDSSVKGVKKLFANRMEYWFN